MKRTLLCAAALLSMSSLSFAADLPSRAVAPAPLMLAPAFTWTGFYVGGNVGAAWSGRDNCPGMSYLDNGVYIADTSYLPNCNGSNKVGVIGGLQAGYNWQFGAWVFGLEGDINWIGRNSGHGYDYPVFGTPEMVYTDGPGYNMQSSNNNRPNRTTVTNHVYSWSGNGDNNMLSTIRARFGFAMDRTLFFITGGVAFRNGGDDAFITDTATTITTNRNVWDSGRGAWNPSVTTSVTTTTYSRNGNGNNTGWALGGGLEYALTPNLSTKIEYLHAQFGNGGDAYHSGIVDDCIAFFGDRKNSVDMVSVGLNYRFVSAPPTAVLARY